MSWLRALLLRYRAAAIVVIAAALCMKSLVPARFMIGQERAGLTIQICSDTNLDQAVKHIAIPMKEGNGGSGAKESKAECPYSAMSMAALSGADPALLVLALAFIIALGFASTPVRAARRALYLRPPLRGPPSLA